MTTHVPFIRPALPRVEKLAPALQSIADANWYSNFGPHEQKFRAGISSFVGGDPNVVTVNNATAGLMGALATLLPRGDERSGIAIASFTFAAGAQAILWHGYRPAWIDVDPVTFQPSILSFLELLETDPGIKAILLTNTFGIGTAEITAWEELAQEKALPLIVDSAAGFGSVYPGGERLGLRGDCEIFSFHATKPFAIGEGGAVLTKSAPAAEQIREFTNFGFTPGKGSTQIGINGKLQELNAAIGSLQLLDFEAALADRRRVLKHYLEQFSDLELTAPANILDSSGCFATFTFESHQRLQSALRALQQAGVEARTYYAPKVHSQPWFLRFEPQVNLSATDSIAQRTISLPVLPDMSSEELKLVVQAVRSSEVGFV